MCGIALSKVLGLNPDLQTNCKVESLVWSTDFVATVKCDLIFIADW